jgi:hypothetical protein
MQRRLNFRELCLIQSQLYEASLTLAPGFQRAKSYQGHVCLRAYDSSVQYSSFQDAESGDDTDRESTKTPRVSYIQPLNANPLIQIVYA